MNKQNHKPTVQTVKCMKTAIIYATSHGTTEKVCKTIAAKIDQSDLIDLKKTGPIDLSSYGQAIIGGSIHAGRIQKRVQSFCQNNRDRMLQMRIGLFICAMNEAEFEKELNLAFPEWIRNHAISKKVTGGEFLFEKMNFIERFLIKKISGISQSVSNIDYSKIDELVAEMSQ